MVDATSFAPRVVRDSSELLLEWVVQEPLDEASAVHLDHELDSHACATQRREPSAGRLGSEGSFEQALRGLGCTGRTQRRRLARQHAQIGEQTWNISVGTADGTELELRKGGTELYLNGRQTVAKPAAEYEGIYEHFAELLKTGRSHVDGAPLLLVSDCFMIGRRAETEAFV